MARGMNELVTVLLRRLNRCFLKTSLPPLGLVLPSVDLLKAKKRPVVVRFALSCHHTEHFLTACPHRGAPLRQLADSGQPMSLSLRPSR